jgi:hypothetical protein
MQYHDLGINGVEVAGNAFEGFEEYTGSCPCYKDPREKVLQSLNKMMFYAGVLAARTMDRPQLLSRIDPNLPVETTVTGHVEGIHNVFHTNLLWFMAAALVEGVSIALILPTYLGWWRLGRPVTFSPLEIAKVGYTSGWNENSWR